MANTTNLKVDAVLVELLTQHRKDNGVLPAAKLNQYLEESPSYKKDLKEFTANKIKGVSPHVS